MPINLFSLIVPILQITATFVKGKIANFSSEVTYKNRTYTFCYFAIYIVTIGDLF